MASFSSFETKHQEFISKFDLGLRDIILQHKSLHPRLRDAMEYSLLSPAKRLRPFLVMLTGRLLNVRADHTHHHSALSHEVAGSRATLDHAVVIVGAAIECIHTYSLIHDDLPCMDDAMLRRGRPSCHVEFDEATALLAGDALLTVAFEILVSLSDLLPAQSVLMLVKGLSQASGGCGMVEGQMRDCFPDSNEDDGLGIFEKTKDLERLFLLKTAKLFEYSCWAGAVVGGGSLVDQDCLARYGRHMGIAFQMVDDILDVLETPAVMGKDVQQDQKLGKSNFVSIYGVDGASRLVTEKIELAFQALESYDHSEVNELYDFGNILLSRIQKNVKKNK